MVQFARVLLLVLDSAGVGAMPDAEEWGDAGADTIGHVVAAEKPSLPELQKLGLGNVRALDRIEPSPHPKGCFGKAAIYSNGKDTTVGHWEMAGIVTDKPFPTYSHGFPDRILDPFRERIGRPVLGNCTASGTAIIEELGREHVSTGNPIVYTSADSVFQIAAHEQVIPLEELYQMCRVARKILDGQDRVARVIARPFIGNPGSFKRTGNRKDFAIPPPGPTLLNALQDAGLAVIGVGKVSSIFDFVGFTEQLEAHNNAEAIDQTIVALGQAGAGLIFANLGDFDMLWGHRRDIGGYARGLEYFDRRLPEIQRAMEERDLLIITADHGCDPAHGGSDHTREYVPIIACGKTLAGGVNLGCRPTLADMGRTIAENFGLRLPHGASFLHELR